MKVDQRILIEDGDGDVGDCFKASVATILGCKYEDVPHFVKEYKDDWFSEFRKWLEENHNMSAVLIRLKNLEDGMPITFPQGRFIMTGQAPWSLEGTGDCSSCSHSDKGWATNLGSCTECLQDGGSSECYSYEPVHHSVVFRGTPGGWEMEHDPHPSREGITTFRSAIVFTRKIGICAAPTTINNKVHLCDSCTQQIPECGGGSLVFGDGRGKDNIAACNAYTPKVNCLANAMEVLSERMKAEPDYAGTWHDNIACMAQDAGASHEVSNDGASRFMKLCFDVDTNEHRMELLKRSEKASCLHLPMHVVVSGSECALILSQDTRDKATYYRPAGNWGVEFEVVKGRLIITGYSDCSGIECAPNSHFIKGKELIPTTKEAFLESNGGYVG